jgi:DNA-binding CsgD family transcriptional regulator
LGHFFPGRPADASGLPIEVAEWLRRKREAERERKCFPGAHEVLLQERAGQRLRLCLYPGVAGSGRILVLGLQTVPETARAFVGSGRLTPREVEVLLQVEQGKTNEETAAALGISPLTVRAHLEHLFEKLDVSSRTGAVTRFRQGCSRAERADPTGEA